VSAQAYLDALEALRGLVHQHLPALTGLPGKSAGTLHNCIRLPELRTGTGAHEVEPVKAVVEYQRPLVQRAADPGVVAQLPRRVIDFFEKVSDIQMHFGVDAHDLSCRRYRPVMHADQVDIGHPAQKGSLAQQRPDQIDTLQAAVFCSQFCGLFTGEIDQEITGNAHGFACLGIG